MGTILFFSSIWLLPRFFFSHEGHRFFDGDRQTHLALANEIAHIVSGDVSSSDFSTGSERFDGEWALVTYQMAVLGLGQVILEYPETKSMYQPAISKCIDRLLEPDIRKFGRKAWGEDGLRAQKSKNGHAYLGYVNLALGMERMLYPNNRHTKYHDRLTKAFVRRIRTSKTGLIETYPGETYPADVSSVIGSIGLYDRVTKSDHSALLERWSRTFKGRYLDARSGLVIQSVNSRTGESLDLPRASGTGISSYFLSFADRELSAHLYRTLKNQHTSFAGFGGIREYPPGSGWRMGDIDSGPVLFGVGVSSTGFSISGARIHGDRNTFVSLFRTASLFGAPVNRSGGRIFVTGGPLGNAIMLAMLTAGPAAAPAQGQP